MPSMMGKAKAKERLLSTLPDEFRKVAQQANVPLNDFPNPYEYAQTLATYDLSKLPKASKEILQLYEDVIERDLPGIMQHFTSTPGAPPPSASSLQPDGELRGWLHKQATSGKWQRRYFALREGTLEYYRRPEEPKPSGAAWKSNFGCPTPWTRRCLRSCVCSMAWSFQAMDATLSPNVARDRVGSMAWRL